MGGIAAWPDDGGGNISVCGNTGPRLVTITWLEVASPDSQAFLPDSIATLVVTNGSRDDLEARVVVTLNRAGISTRHTLPPLLVAAGQQQALEVDLAADSLAIPRDSVSYSQAHAYFVRTDRSTVTQAAADPFSFLRDASGAVLAFGEEELRRRIESRELPGSEILDRLEPDPEATVAMVAHVDGSRHRQAQEMFDVEAALAYEQELIQARQNEEDEEIDR